MASLNLIASSDAMLMGRPFDTPLIENIKVLYRQLAPKYIRQSIERNGVDDIMRKGYVAKLTRASRLDPCVIEGCTIVRTELKVPTPLRYKSDVPFLYVGVADLLKPRPFIYILPVELKYINSYKLNNRIPRYFYLNDYLYFINIGLVEEVRVINIWENPDEVVSYCTNDCWTDDMEYPIPMDIISAIKKEIFDFYNVKMPDSDVTVTNSPELTPTK
jgi:hypothetical protein